MQAIILAAGQGKRLHPHTEDWPKCMIPLGGRPLLHWQLDALRSCGVRPDVVVIGGYRHDRINAPGIRLLVNHRFDCTNMVATLFCGVDAIVEGEDLLICYGDIVYESGVLQALLACRAPVCVAADRAWRRLWQLRMDDPLRDAETFKMYADGRLLELGKKPRSYAEVEAQYIGLIRVRGDHVHLVLEHYRRMDRARQYDGKDFANMYMTSFIQDLIDNNWEVCAALVQNGWLEIDTSTDLARYQAMFDNGSLRDYCDLGCTGGQLS